MNDYNYVLKITFERKEKNTTPIIKGKLTITGVEENVTPFFNAELKTEEMHFDPLYVLGDLRNQEEPYEYPYGRMKDTKPSNLASNDYQYEYGFGKPIYLGIGEREEYIAFLSELNECLTNGTSVEQFVELQKQYKIPLNCKIQMLQKNILNTYFGDRLNSNSEYIYTDLEYQYGLSNGELISKEYLHGDHQFIYTCNSLTEVVMSVYHFLVVHNYTFRKCALCQKYYIRISRGRRSSACERVSSYNIENYLSGNRISTYLGYKKRTCKINWKYIKEQNREQNKYMNRFWNNYDNPVTFRDDYEYLMNKLQDELSKNRCFKNLENICILSCSQIKKEIWKCDTESDFAIKKKELENRLSGDVNNIYNADSI